MTNLNDFLRRAQQRLTQAEIDNPALDARVLTAAVLGCDRAALLVQGDRPLSKAEEETLTLYIERRAKHEPVGRLLGRRAFWGMDLALNEATLEPRPDTETLVETALRLAGKHRTQEAGRVLDLGTGTGAILLALLQEWPKATGLGIDCAGRAIEQAALNAATLGLASRAAFRLGNWLEGVTERFDVIVSNPPYIPSAEIGGLMPEVRLFDPLAALDGGADGLDPYRLLAPLLPSVLVPGGWVFFEVGQGQAQDVASFLEKAGLTALEIVDDLAGIARCVAACCPYSEGVARL